MSNEFRVEFNKEPMHCPKCGSEDIEAGEYETDGNGNLICEVSCPCNFEWVEYYKFQAWEPGTIEDNFTE